MAFLDREGLQEVWAHMNSQIYKKAEKNKDELTLYLINELAKRNQLAPEFANSVEECTDQSKLYVLPDGYIYAYLRSVEIVEGGPAYTNLLTASTTEIKTHTRYSQSGATFKTGVSGVDAVIFPIPAGEITLRFRGITYGSYSSSDKYPYIYGGTSNTAFPTTFVPNDSYWTPGADGDIVITFNNASGCTYAVMHLEHANMSTGIATLNEEIINTEGGTVITEGWASTGHAFVPADYEDRIIAAEEAVNDLDGRVKALERIEPVDAIHSMVYAPSPQLPADGSETADFDAANISATEIYAYIDALAAKHPRYLTKEVLGKDESGTYDWCRYTASRRTYDAWVEPTYPAMYGWTSGSTTIYSVSVSPRVGDTMYSTANIGTAYSTVTAVDNANQTRTVNGLIFARDTSADIAPTLVYTYTDYDTRRGYSLATWHNSVYNSSRSKIGTISDIANGVLTDTDGNSYTRYPIGDRNSSFEKLPALVIGSNEHGGNITGDPAEGAIISARLIKDLCECRHADNAFLNMLKSEYMIVFCPIINPWGYGKEDGYCNANGVNIDRNFDTPGWGHDTDTRHGEYGGSENETQFFMNTVFASGAKIALANHVLGTQDDTNNCGYMLGRDNPKYNAHLAGIAETMAVNYDLAFITMGQAPGDEYGKTRSYLDHIGVEGGALEMCALAGYFEDGGTRHTAQALEADYTLLLQFLNMLIECKDL